MQNSSNSSTQMEGCMGSNKNESNSNSNSSSSSTNSSSKSIQVSSTDSVPNEYEELLNDFDDSSSSSSSSANPTNEGMDYNVLTKIMEILKKSSVEDSVLKEIEKTIALDYKKAILDSVKSLVLKNVQDLTDAVKSLNI
jgi:hypothetical protein